MTKDINESKGKRSVCAFCKVNICTRILCIFDIKFIASHDKVMNGGHKILHKVSILLIIARYDGKRGDLQNQDNILCIPGNW